MICSLIYEAGALDMRRADVEKAMAPLSSLSNVVTNTA